MLEEQGKREEEEEEGKGEIGVRKAAWWWTRSRVAEDLEEEAIGGGVVDEGLSGWKRINPGARGECRGGGEEEQEEDEENEEYWSIGVEEDAEDEKEDVESEWEGTVIRTTEDDRSKMKWSGGEAGFRWRDRRPSLVGCRST